jgi:hypothetical protein
VRHEESAPFRPQSFFNWQCEPLLARLPDGRRCHERLPRVTHAIHTSEPITPDMDKEVLRSPTRVGCAPTRSNDFALAPTPQGWQEDGPLY